MLWPTHRIGDLVCRRTAFELSSLMSYNSVKTSSAFDLFSGNRYIPMIIIIININVYIIIIN